MHDYLNEHQIRAVNALRLLKQICEEEGIRFYLLAGTTLGAVRHKGMIPWDDDIDVGLLRDDWLKLRKVLKYRLDGTEYKYKDNENDYAFPRLYGKILYNKQACIDLFLIAKWTDNDLQGRIHLYLTHLTVRLYKQSIHYSKRADLSESNFIKITKYFLKRGIQDAAYICTRPILKRKGYIKLARHLESAFEKKKTNTYINIYSIYPMEKEKIKAEWLLVPGYVEYEGEEYLTVGDTDAYLKHLYGDYMIPPSVEERYARHTEEF